MTASPNELIILLKQMKAYDVSPLFEANMPTYITHPPMEVIHDARNFEQHNYYSQTLIIPEHTGSHVDAPAHVQRQMQEFTIDTYPVDYLIGPYKKYDFTPFDLKPGDQVSTDTLKSIENKTGFQPESGDIILLQFGWDKYFHPETKDQKVKNWWGINAPGLSKESCQYFTEAKIRAIGSDTSGCDVAEENGVVKAEYGHTQYFLPNHILIIEGLQNLNLAPNVGIFFALPLKIKHGSGSPIRPILFG